MTVILDNPPRQFQSRTMTFELFELLKQLERDRSIGAVVITGAHPRSFLTHYDVAEILAGARVTPDLSPRVFGALLRVVGLFDRLPGAGRLLDNRATVGLLANRRVHQVYLAMNDMDKVFIAAINGPAMGGGCELALACDLRYMAAEAPGIGQPEILAGFPPGGGGTQRLTRAVGTGRALELMLEGSAVSPERALEIGLVNTVFPARDLMAEATATAARLARRAPESIEGLKRDVLEGSRLPLDAGLAVERKWFMSTVSRPAARRAMRAYVDEVASAESPPFADLERLRPWQDGTAVDLLGE
jgi:enoyl-CoA hydratase